MNEFHLYFQLGLTHIADLSAYDHILFVITLALAYSLEEWKKLLWLITAFTVGHSLTLALAALKYIQFQAEIVEFLIPCTIMFNVLVNFYQIDKAEKNVWINYAVVSLFGLIHGLGFSNYLQSLLGKELSIVMPLFAFNIGLEIGQLLILVVFFGINFLLKNLLGVTEKSWKIFVLGGVFGITLLLLRDTWLW